MTEVFSLNKLPARRIYQKAVLSLHAHEDLGHEIMAVQRQMAQAIAQKIMAQPDFFKQDAQGQFVTYWANVIVLTDDELAQMMRDQFAAGVKHAQGFMPEHHHDHP